MKEYYLIGVDIGIPQLRPDYLSLRGNLFPRNW
jgi:hypothetical protein